MRQFTKQERENATMSFTLNYKPRGMKEVITPPVTIKLSELTDKEFNMLLSIVGGDRSYKSRKLVTHLKPKYRNGQVVEVFDGYTWSKQTLGSFEISRGYCLTGMHNETVQLDSDNVRLVNHLNKETNGKRKGARKKDPG